ncbi:MAG: gamma-glutamyltransferase, partial [Saprospiraceae bacterium]|nr:gamma-glutamyltransferase [Saprospiraceae bacterium]
MQNNKGLFTYSNILFLFIIGSILCCKPSPSSENIYDITKSALSDSAMVVSAHPLATSAGLDIIRKGGNAVDAAIAIQFVLAVCYPGAGNIGGGGFMLTRSAGGELNALDFREKAPSASSADMYLDSVGNPDPLKSMFGHLAAGVPGTVDGMIEAYNKYSKLKDWKKLLQPAIEIAKNGFRITEGEANNLNENKENFEKYNHSKTVFQKEKWTAGDVLIQSDLAATLEIIRDLGRDGFYKGQIADLIVAEMISGGGIITKEDMSNYKSIWRTPVTGNYRGYKIISMPPPSSGGIALIQLLKMIEPFRVDSLKFQSAASIHLMVEAERRVYADRAKHLGDPDFYQVPSARLLDSMYIASRLKDFNPRQAGNSKETTYGLMESEETTHYSIVDTEGNAVAVTTTLNGGYGSFTVVSGAGFILNNEMDDFSIKPGTPNMYGLVGAEANKIEPDKRMLSSMTPTIVEKDGRLLMVLGTPGGSTIITSVFQTIVNVLDFEMTIDQAVQSSKFHHQWLPDIIQTENDAIEIKERKILESIGHKIEDRGPIGRV